jgi:hypothetical protein
MLFDLAAGKYEEVYYIERWAYYWMRVAGAYNPEIIPKLFSGIDQVMIQRAREFPLESLVGGKQIRAGRDFICLCPFHEERTPSFHIYTKDNHYKCFGCGVGGDAISYVMQKEKLSFPEAIRRLT